MQSDFQVSCAHFKQAVQESLKTSHLLFKQVLPLALLLLGVSHLLNLYFMAAQELAPEDMVIKIMSIAGSISADLIGSLVFLFLVPLRMLEKQNSTPQKGFWEFFRSIVGPWTIEGLRMTAYILLWTLLLILPGIYKALRWSFMSFLVAFDPAYKAGEYDPLKKSNELTKGSLLFVFLLASVENGFIILSSWMYGSFESLAFLTATPYILKLAALGGFGLFGVLLKAVVLVYIYGVWFRYFQLRMEAASQRIQPAKEVSE